MVGNGDPRRPANGTQTNPDDAELLSRSGIENVKEGKRDIAESQLRRALEFDPSWANRWVELSRAIEDDRQAAEKLREALNAFPDSGKAKAELAKTPASGRRRYPCWPIRAGRGGGSGPAIAGAGALLPGKS